MTELSFMGKLMKTMELSKATHTGLILTCSNVIELTGEIESLKSYIAELEEENASLVNTPVVDETLALAKRVYELDTEVTKCHELQDSYCDRIAELEADKKRAEQMVERLIEAGDEYGVCLHNPDINRFHRLIDAGVWHALVAEWQANPKGDSNV